MQVFEVFSLDDEIILNFFTLYTLAKKDISAVPSNERQKLVTYLILVTLKTWVSLILRLAIEILGKSIEVELYKSFYLASNPFILLTCLNYSLILDWENYDRMYLLESLDTDLIVLSFISSI